MKLTKLFETAMTDAQYVYNTYYIFDELNDNDVIIEEESSYKYRVMIHKEKVVNVIPVNDGATEQRAEEIMDEIKNRK